MGRIIICMRVTYGPPAVWSFVRQCDKCGQEVWLSQRYEAEPGDIFRCVPCAAPEIADQANNVEAAPWAGEDFKEKLAELLKRMK